MRRGPAVIADMPRRSRQPAIEADDQLFHDDHRDDDNDQPDETMQDALETQSIAEDEGQDLEDHELGSEQDQPRDEEFEGLPGAALLALETSEDAVLRSNRRLEQDLEDDRGEQARRER